MRYTILLLRACRRRLNFLLIILRVRARLPLPLPLPLIPLNPLLSLSLSLASLSISCFFPLHYLPPLVPKLSNAINPVS